MLEAHKDEIIAYFMVWNLVAMLTKYLYLYWVSEVEIYLDNILACKSKMNTDSRSID